MEKEPKFELIEIFYSVQGEGRYQGAPAIFIRLSRCDMHCHFCDTPYNKVNMEMTGEEIRDEVLTLRHNAGNVMGRGKPMIVLTGGEPALQLQDEAHNIAMRKALRGFFVAIETTGMHPIPSWITWITISPKVWPVNLDTLAVADELKFLMFPSGQFSCGNTEEIAASCEDLPLRDLYVQPITDPRDSLKTKEAEQKALLFVKANANFMYGNRLQNQLEVR